MAQMEGLPGGAQLWRVGEQHYAVYMVPGTDVPLMYHFGRSGLLEAATGSKSPEVDRAMSRRDANQRGAIEMGVTAELDSELGRHPWDSFRAKIERDTDIAPWLKDPEVLAHVASSWLRGTSPNLERTQWWQNKTDRERQWIEKAATNPTQARQELKDARTQVGEALHQSGATQAPARLRNFMADKLTTGEWSQTKLESQLRRLTDPGAPGRLDPELGEVMISPEIQAHLDQEPDTGTANDLSAAEGGAGAVAARIAKIRKNRGLGRDPESDRIWAKRIMDAEGDRAKLDLFATARRRIGEKAINELGSINPGQFGRTREHEDTVEAEVNRWLGPAIAQGWDDEQIERWAGRLRNDPNAEIELTEHLQRQRLALFPEHENPELTYEDIASPWRGFVQQHWGQQADEMDPMFHQLVRNNDAAANLTLLRKKGLERGVGKVTQDLQSEALRVFNGQVRQAAL